ncbi:MAG: hypothetical protein O2960_28160 [Verrucomicrobia bacterium]|jgi:hypothetical protein|nr:hypothetical protein [Verrucomicrobiota bacterium]
MITEFGKVAYDAYCDARGWKSVLGEPLPKFEDQSKDLQDAWQASGKAAVQEWCDDFDIPE